MQHCINIFSIYTYLYCIIRLNEAIKVNLKDFFIEGEEWRFKVSECLKNEMNYLWLWIN